MMKNNCHVVVCVMDLALNPFRQTSEFESVDCVLLKLD